MPLPAAGLIAFIRSPAAKWIGIAVLVSLLAWRGYSVIDSRGYSRCEVEHELARLQAVEKQMDATLDEIERGEKISERLAQTQRRLNDVKTEYLTYANAIVGNCPAALGLLNNAAVSGDGMPETASPSVDSSAQISASALGANIAENYARCLANTAQLSALIEWARPQDTVK